MEGHAVISVTGALVHMNEGCVLGGAAWPGRLHTWPEGRRRRQGPEAADNNRARTPPASATTTAAGG
jgi:hypothetical protein